MFKFEGIKKNKEELKDKEETTILQKIRDSKINKKLRPVFIGSAIGAGVGGIISKEINNIEFSKEKERAKEYDTTQSFSFTTDTVKYLSDSFISEIAIKENIETRKFLLLEKEEIIKLLNGDKERINNKGYINNLIKLSHNDGIEIKDINLFKKEINTRTQENILGYEEKLNEMNLELQKDEVSSIETTKKEIKDRIIGIMILIEKAKLEVIKHIESDEYLEKLSKEMNISKKLAKLHQDIRINNIKNISYSLESSNQISEDSKGGYAYYSSGTNKITLPYNINLNDSDFFYEAIVHEILHESTMSNYGISETVEEFLGDSFKNYEYDDKKDSLYISKPRELIVRKQILDLEMEKLGIKKYGEIFTEEHYKKLLKLQKEYKLSLDAIQFINHIKPEDFVKVMNELAENNSKEEKRNYYSSKWNYGENQA